METGRKQVSAFQETAKTFFVLWEEGVGSISTASIQEASKKRLEAARNQILDEEQGAPE